MNRALPLLVPMLAMFAAGAGPALADRGTVTRTIPAPGGTPTGLAFDGRLLWVADHKDARLFAVDPASGAVARSVAAPSLRTVGLAFDGERLWTLDGARRMAFRLDPDTGVVDHRIELEAASPRGLAWRAGRLVVSDDRKGVIHEVDASDGTTVRTIPAPAPGTSGIAFAGDVLYVANRQDDAIFAVDFATGTVHFRIDAPGKHPTGMTAVGGGLAVADYHDDAVAFLDPASGTPLITGTPRPLDVTFTFTLHNGGPDPVATASVFLAIPKERAYQAFPVPVAFDPAPVAIVTEPGGQELARFDFTDVPAGGVRRVVMTARAVLRPVRYLLLPSDVGRLKEVPKDVARLYTRDGSKLLLDDTRVREVAATLAKDASNPLTLVRRTYDFVADHLRYDLTGGWNAAPMLLERGTGSCSEYSFLLMALLRANGVPARYVGSLVVRGDDASWDDVYHRWVEVYLPGVGWVPIDANKGDKETPAQRAAGFGELDDRFAVTTESPGGTDLLGWTYNHEVRHACAGQCTVAVDTVAEWSPVPAAPVPSVPPPAGATDPVP